MTVDASRLIRRAMRLIGVLDSDQAMTATEAQDALDTLNGMLAEWHEAGMGLPEYQLPALTDTLSTDAADSDAISYQLAIRIAPEYGVQMTPEAIAEARMTLFRLRSRYFSPTGPIPATYY